jgi:hypothetical protein
MNYNELDFNLIKTFFLLYIIIMSCTSGLISGSLSTDIIIDIVLLTFVFTFTFEMSTESPVKELVSGLGGYITSMPGVIFSLDIDSILFAILYKIVIAPLIIVIFAIIVFFFKFSLAMLISPICFIFTLIHNLVKSKN